MTYISFQNQYKAFGDVMRAFWAESTGLRCPSPFPQQKGTDILKDERHAYLGINLHVNSVVRTRNTRGEMLTNTIFT